MAVICRVCDTSSLHEHKKRRKKMYGWRGTIPRVDLTGEKVTKQLLNESIARNFIGGIEFDAYRLEEAADRIYTLERAFNIRQGISRKHDRLPQKSVAKGTRQEKEELEKHAEMLTDYYRVHGYDPETGVPTRKRLERIGLRYVAEELGAHNPYQDWDGAPLWHPHEYPHGKKHAFVNEDEV